jgi:hypothetical protein
LDQDCSGLYDDDIWECIKCYLNLPDIPHPDENPLNYAHIQELQQQDEQLLALQVKYPDNYVNLQLDGKVDDIICYKKDPTQPMRKLCCLNQWLSWECRRHVGDVSATCRFVPNFGSTCVSCLTQDSKKVQPTPDFVSATPILDTVIVCMYVIKYQKF